MSSDAAPTTPAADRVPEPRSGLGPVAVPDDLPDEPPDAPVRDAAADTDAPDSTDTDTDTDTVDTAADDDAAVDDAAVDDAAGEVPEASEASEASEVSEVDEVDDSRGGRLTARVREARVLLTPELPVIPAPRSPGGVVPPPTLGRRAAPAAGLVEAVEDLRGELADLEDDPGSPERQALVRVLDLSVAGVPDAGWSTVERIDAATLAGAAEIAGTLHASATALLDRLDAEECTASAVEVDAVVTALQVARMVLDLESFARHGR